MINKSLESHNQRRNGLRLVFHEIILTRKGRRAKVGAFIAQPPDAPALPGSKPQGPRPFTCHTRKNLQEQDRDYKIQNSSG